MFYNLRKRSTYVCLRSVQNFCLVQSLIPRCLQCGDYFKNYLIATFEGAKTMNLVKDLIVGTLCIGCVACAPDKMYRNNFTACNAEAVRECENNSMVRYFPEASNEFHLGYIEFDDQGQLRD